MVPGIAAAPGPNDPWQPDWRQEPLAQSEPMRQRSPNAHNLPAPQEPPQSTSDSAPFWAPSAQVATAQTWSKQTFSLQSLPTKQAFVTAQGGQPEFPPQSMS